jgi:hypothetical protein
VTAIEDQQPVVTQAGTIPTKHSAIAVAFGARSGLLTIRLPLARKTSSRRRVLAVAVADQEPDALLDESRLRLRGRLDRAEKVRNPGSSSPIQPCSLLTGTKDAVDHRGDPRIRAISR